MSRHGALATSLVLLLLTLAGCTRSSITVRDGTGAIPRLAPQPRQALHFLGKLAGAFPGIGPSVDIEAWLRGDGLARVDLRYEGETAEPKHEILLWSGEYCLLFDAVGGRYTELGEIPGRLEALDNRFELRDAVFLLCARDPLFPGVEPTEFFGAGDSYRGVRESGSLHRDGPVAGLRWQGNDLAIHEITARYEDILETTWGEWPLRVEFTGTGLEAAARLRWEEIQPIVAVGDSIFDPLWEPAPR